MKKKKILKQPEKNDTLSIKDHESEQQRVCHLSVLKEVSNLNLGTASWFFVCFFVFATTLENNLAFPLKKKQTYNTCTLRHLFQRTENSFSHRSLCKNIQSSFICHSPRLGTSRCPPLSGRLNKQWSVYIMGYYSAVKRSELDTVASWMYLKEMRLSLKSQR